jgi:hypothetical protein
MNPVLRELYGPRRSIADIADLLERHIGDGSDPARCEEALAALRRVREQNPTYYLRIALREIDAGLPACETIRAVVSVLRKWRFYSGT